MQFFHITSSSVISFPEKKELKISHETREKLLELNDYDVLEVYEDGTVVRVYDNCSDENLFFITGRCNSNCIMCPSPEYSRRNSGDASINALIERARHIPVYAKHFTITGGEPFLIGKEIFSFLQFLQGKFTRTDFQILTNGRVFALPEYCDRLAETIPQYTILGIPLHASTASLHDGITRTKESFEQTTLGISELLHRGLAVELRVVVSKLNVDDLADLAQYILMNYPTVDHVSIMGMEMTGTAHDNREQLWVPYKETFPKIRKAVDKLIEHGINVMLFNFPLCTVDPGYWTLCRRSISPHKIRYVDNCRECRMRSECGGVFLGTLKLEGRELKPIR